MQVQLKDLIIAILKVVVVKFLKVTVQPQLMKQLSISTSYWAVTDVVSITPSQQQVVKFWLFVPKQQQTQQL